MIPEKAVRAAAETLGPWTVRTVEPIVLARATLNAAYDEMHPVYSFADRAKLHTLPHHSVIRFRSGHMAERSHNDWFTPRVEHNINSALTLDRNYPITVLHIPAPTPKGTK